ncbi:hypothetical protein EXS74_02925 [Candidatus Woesearchaeota archaeon]|nr:hypothetical protein [Candidatus Woesearchaeota archaeon]
MKYVAYVRFQAKHYRSLDYIETAVGLAIITSESSTTYGATTIEITGRGIGKDLESLVKQDGWRKGSIVLDKNEEAIELTQQIQ